MRIPRSRRSARPVAVLAALSLTLTLAPTALASPPDASSPPGEVGVQLVLDCSSVPNTREARNAARRYHVCESGPTTEPVAFGSVTSNCGTLSLTLGNRGGGVMQWTGRLTSSLGPFTQASYAGTWSNPARHRGGNVSRSLFGFTSDWFDSFPIGTGSGTVFGVIGSAAYQLWWGPFCFSSFPVDAFTVVT